ncbi:DUF1801 domain-containing protein [Herbiconiux sp. CPCC 205763]|uniref:DUF1801 domain-containing protein n=1 Tax=Herbiconiux aconitum TaxID=2970913 RepID=A0ABT2GVF5_9MICO|nr:DUF1801 domain-containing protein [Herbiconiux aconitum]MCS5720193.1 DUF1801 domain-containing protein [Herbiconiux aconitum]
MDDKISQYIEKVEPWQAVVCRELRTMVHTTIPDVEESFQYGKPHFLKNGEYAAVIAVAKDKVNFMVFNAQEVPEVKGVLRSLGNGERKAATLTDGQDVDYPFLADILAKTTSAP